MKDAEFHEPYSPRYRRRLERDRYYTQAIDRSDLPSSSPPLTMTAPAGQGSKLAQEIHDEFLTCKICLEGFKSPKCLDCLHTFCEQCIENHVMSECTYKKYSDYREFTCPLCRKRTALPLGGVKKLPDNFLVSSLSEMVQRQKPSKFPFCDICKLVNRKHREASSKCLDCNKLLCKQCVDMHKETKVTKGHSLFDVEIEKDIECKEHQEEVVRFYCEPCETCICVLCTFNEHKDHEITQFSDAVVKYKESIQTLLNNCKERINGYDNQMALLGKCETLVKAAEQKIRDVAIQFIADIRTREKQLIEELHAMYGAEVMEYITRRSEMQVNLDSLKSTCSLTEIVLKGKDIELLLLKKQVQEKLSCLNDIQLRELPSSVNRQITFAPGSLELGKLEDAGTAGSGKADASTPGDGLHIRTIETQTDWGPPRPKGKLMERGMQTIPVHQGTSTSGQKADMSTATDSISTTEKAVNTRSRSLQSLTHQLQKTPSKEEATPGGEGQGGENPEPSSPVTARRRRRRERARGVEVSVRPTTNSVVDRKAMLSYGSSVDESYFSPDTVPNSPSP